MRVEPMVLGGHERFHEIILSAAKKKYPSKRRRFEEGDFRGRRLRQLTDMSIVCDQTEYASKVEAIPIAVAAESRRRSL